MLEDRRNSFGDSCRLRIDADGAPLYADGEDMAFLTVRALDREGKVFEKTGEDLLARAFCHEIDHLSGVLYTDKAESVQQIMDEE